MGLRGVAQLVGEHGQELVLAALGLLRLAQQPLGLGPGRPLPLKEFLPLGPGPGGAAAGLALLQRRPDRRHQPEVVLGGLDDVIVQPGLHRLDRHLLVAGPGEHDDRPVRVRRLDPVQHPEAVAPVELVIGDDEVERARLQRLRELLVVDDMLAVQVGEDAPQLPLHEEAVLGVVVDDQHAQHRPSPPPCAVPVRTGKLLGRRAPGAVRPSRPRGSRSARASTGRAP
jgi:hypothetical protein